MRDAHRQRAGRTGAAAMALIITGVLLAACSGGTTVDAEAPEDAAPPAAAAGEWAKTLPMEPGYAWQTARYPGGGTMPVQLSVAGPWTLEAGPDWPVTTSAIVDAAEVPSLDGFEGYSFIQKDSSEGVDFYYPRQVTEEWMLQLGKVSMNGTQATAEPYSQPLRLWPVDIEVGDAIVVSDTGSFGINATVLAKSSVTVPAGTIDEAYLVRFDYTALAEGAMEGAQYYILSPEVGFVALFSVAAGDEASGFTALDSLQVLVSMPER